MSLILTVRQQFEKHDLGQQIFKTVKSHLSESGMTMWKGTIEDATSIAAPSSTENKERKLDPDTHQIKKGNQWLCGMKVHAGMDKNSGLNHSVVVTSSNVHDLTPAADLLHGDEEVVYGDASTRALSKGPKWKPQKVKSECRCCPAYASLCLTHQKGTANSN